MTQPFLGEIDIFPFNFAPVGWAVCNGQILSIAQNTALFSLLGTNFGGNGTSNFALPNLQGSVPVAAGQGTGLTPRIVGESGGEASVTLLQTQLPAHNHGVNASGNRGASSSPNGALPAIPAVGAREPDALYSTTAPTVSMLGNSALTAGGNQAHNNLQPYLTLTFCIALVGIFPERQ